jgi:hypothetical protein
MCSSSRPVSHDFADNGQAGDRSGSIQTARRPPAIGIAIGFALNAHEAAAALQSLQPRLATTSVLAPSGSPDISGGSIPSTFAGWPTLAANQPAQAAAEFKRIIDNRGIVLVDPVDAMARLQLARALALSGDTVKAKSAYDDLLTVLKDADPKVPIVEQGRAEYARR